jgi:DNA-binding NtrC family response regulator
VGDSVTLDALELQDSAEALRAAQHPAEAIARLEEALHLEGPLEDSVVAEIRVQLADCHSEMNNHVAAQEAIGPLLEKAPDEVWRARALARLARAKFYLGDLELATGLYGDALRILAGAPLPAETAMALQWLGNALQGGGKTTEAHEAFRDAVALARLSQDNFRLASCLASLALLNIQRSQYKEARPQYEKCIALLEAIGHRRQVARAHLNLSVCLFYLGDWVGADREIERAQRLYGELSDLRGSALCKLALYRLARRRGEDTRQMLLEATELAEKSGYRRARLLALEERADIAREAGDLGEAEELYEKLFQLATPEAPGGDISYETRARLGLVRLESGRVEEAEQLTEEALEGAIDASDLREEAFCRTALARVQQSVGQEERATSEVQRAIRILEKIETPYELAQALEVGGEILGRPRFLERARDLYRSLGLAKATTRGTGGVEERFVAVSAKGRDLVKTARRLGQVQTSILLTGETGVGKSLFARLIHEKSPRAQAAFGVLNCANWSEGRVQAKRAPDPVSLFEETAGGTVLLKSVDLAKPALQEILIGALESARRDVGMPPEDAPGLQVISTTREDLERLVEQGRFLSELYYRLTGLVIEVPPLRERIDDVNELAQRFTSRTLPADVLQLLRKHAWQGNVRELRNVLRSAVFAAGDEELVREHFPEALGEPRGEPQTLPERIEALERREIRAALERTGNNKRIAARELGVSRKGLIDRLKRLHMWDEYGRTS